MRTSRFGFDLGRPTAIQTTIPSIGDKSESAGKTHYKLPKRETKGTAATLEGAYVYAQITFHAFPRFRFLSGNKVLLRGFNER